MSGVKLEGSAMKPIPAFFLAGMLSMIATGILEALIVGLAVLIRALFTNEPFSIQQWQPFLGIALLATTLPTWFYFWKMLRASV